MKNCESLYNQAIKNINLNDFEKNFLRDIKQRTWNFTEGEVSEKQLALLKKVCYKMPNKVNNKPVKKQTEVNSNVIDTKAYQLLYGNRKLDL